MDRLGVRELMDRMKRLDPQVSRSRDDPGVSNTRITKEIHAKTSYLPTFPNGSTQFINGSDLFRSDPECMDLTGP